MPDEPSTLSEWKRFLAEQMKILDVVWEEGLDPIWQFAPADTVKQVADKADAFYQAYWDVFRSAVKAENIDDLRREVGSAVGEAQKIVAEAWKMVAGEYVDRAERGITQTNVLSSPLSKAKQLFRDAKEAATKGDRLISPGDKPIEAVKEFRNAIGLSIKCEDEIDDAARANNVAIQKDSREKAGLKISKARLWVAIVAVVLAVASAGWWGRPVLDSLFPSSNEVTQES